MKSLASFLSFLLVVYFIAGCQQSVTQPTVVAESSLSIQPKDPVTKEPVEYTEVNQEDDKPSRADRFLNKAGDILKKAKDATSEGDGVTKDWILDQIQEATGDQNVIPDDASDWAQKMFDVLKDKGMTGANDAGEWVTEDIRNMNAYKYKVVKVSLDDLEALEDQLNHFGQLKWECFYVSERSGDTIMFFKKQKRSILKNIPVKDMLKIVPMMTGSDD